MSLEQVLSLFPQGSQLAVNIERLMSTDHATSAAAFVELTRMETHSFSTTEALATLEAVRRLEFPPQEYAWDDPKRQLCDCLWNSPAAELAPVIADIYATASEGVKDSLLILLSGVPERLAARTLAQCVQDHGWPDPSPRIFWQLPTLSEFADELFPALLLACDSRFTKHLEDTIAAGFQHGCLTSQHFERCSDVIEQRCQQGLAVGHRCHQSDGIAWRFDEANDYFDVRHDLAFLLELLGHLPEQPVAPLTEKALQLNDPLVQLAAATARMRSGLSVSDQVLEAVATSHETREPLFERLSELNELERFPPAWRTWDAFAAAEMTRWLMQQTEHRREPDELRKMDVLTTKSDQGEASLYVWRFRNHGDRWYAAVSGGYLLDGPPRPLHGLHTFSVFRPWEEGTPQQHATECVGTLAQIYTDES